MVILGFGAIGSGVLPLLFRHIDMKPGQLIVLSDQYNQKQRDHAAAYGVELHTAKLTKNDYKPYLEKYLSSGDFLINLSVDVSSCALIEFCQHNNVLYMDTCNEPWAGGYSDPNVSAAERTNYAFREEALEFRKAFKKDGPTALITHGANPGLVSHFVKAALLNIAKDTNTAISYPKSQAEWANLAEQLGIKTIHIAERDTQASASVVKHDQVHTHAHTLDLTRFGMSNPTLADGRTNSPTHRMPCLIFFSLCRSSSTPGRSRATSRRASSPPSSDGEPTRSTGPTMERRTTADGQKRHDTQTTATHTHAASFPAPSSHPPPPPC